MLNYIKNLFSNTPKPQEESESSNASDLDTQKLFKTLAPQIEATATNCIGIKTTTEKAVTLKNSKFGGLPYFPKDQEFPQDKEGKPMRLLAQLNFLEIPHVPAYPKKGLLQFYIAENDIYGLDFDNPLNQEEFRVLFFEDLTFEPREDLANIYESEWEDSPIQIQPLSLTFKEEKDYPNYPSLEYYAKIQPLFKNIEKGALTDLLEDLYLEREVSAGHKIGGTPYFTQNEIRESKADYKDYQLLFQMDSEGNKILWGDIGVANFFIKKEDLAKRDFSKVLYNWDCH